MHYGTVLMHAHCFSTVVMVQI